MKRGFQRVKIDGTFYEIDQAPALDKKLKHDIDVVVDRLVVRPDLGTRLADTLETALKLAEGLAVVELADEAARPPRKGRSSREARGWGSMMPHPGSRSAIRPSPFRGGEESVQQRRPRRSTIAAVPSA